LLSLEFVKMHFPSLDMVGVASSNLVAPTKFGRVKSLVSR
jgi:hypothetical protein